MHTASASLRWEEPPTLKDPPFWVRLSVSTQYQLPLLVVTFSADLMRHLEWTAGADHLNMRIGRDEAGTPVALQFAAATDFHTARVLRRTKGLNGAGQVYFSLPPNMARRILSQPVHRFDHDQAGGGTLRLDISGLFAPAEAVA